MFFVTFVAPSGRLPWAVVDGRCAVGYLRPPAESVCLCRSTVVPRALYRGCYVDRSVRVALVRWASLLVGGAM